MNTAVWCQCAVKSWSSRNSRSDEQGNSSCLHVKFLFGWLISYNFKSQNELFDLPHSAGYLLAYTGLTHPRHNFHWKDRYSILYHTFGNKLDLYGSKVLEMNSEIYCRSFLFGFMKKNKKPSQLILLILQRSAQPVGRAHFQAILYI